MKAKEYVAKFEATMAEARDPDDLIKKALGELGNGLRKDLAELSKARGSTANALIGALDEVSLKYAAIRKLIKPEGILREDGFERLLDHVAPGIVTQWKLKKKIKHMRGGGR